MFSENKQLLLTQMSFNGNILSNQGIWMPEEMLMSSLFLLLSKISQYILTILSFSLFLKVGKFTNKCSNDSSMIFFRIFLYSTYSI